MKYKIVDGMRRDLEDYIVTYMTEDGDFCSRVSDAREIAYNGYRGIVDWEDHELIEWLADYALLFEKGFIELSEEE